MTFEIAAMVRLIFGSAVCALLLASCSSAGTTGKVIAETSSAANGVTALVTVDSGGATTSYVYRVYLKDKGSNGAFEVLRMSGSEPSVVWRQAEIFVQIRCGKIFSYHNFHDVINGGNVHDRINVRLSTTSLCRTTTTGNSHEQ